MQRSVGIVSEVLQIVGYQVKTLEDNFSRYFPKLNATEFGGIRRV